MRRSPSFLLTVLASVAGTVLLAQSPAPVARAGSDADLGALKALAAERAPWLAQGRTPAPSESILWMSTHANQVAEAGVAFYEAHPGQPVRWEGALLALKTLRSFITGVKPGVDEATAAKDFAKANSLMVRDEAARAAWNRKLDELQAELLAASDVPPTVLADAYVNALYRGTLRPGVALAQRWDDLQPLLAAMEKRVTNPERLARAFDLVDPIFQKADPAGYAEFLQRQSQSQQPVVARWASGKVNVLAGQTEAVQMKFTALDGREVDLAQLRGKVVLIDFWATWCGPCKEELPNVRANYVKYHDRGFEVIGVSLDTEKDKQKLMDYVREHDLPWPQHFDGRMWKNEFAVRYAINGIPAMFLLDQNGRVVSTNARGEALEREVKRLLKL